MKIELTITIIVCAVIFSGMGVLAFDTMNNTIITHDKRIPPTTQLVNENIEDKEKYSVDFLSKNPKTTYIPSGDGTTKVKTIVGMTIPKNNTLPWGYVEGTIDNPAPGHPVVIQFLRSFDGLPMHIAQVDVNPDNSYLYKFRVLSIDDGIANHIFQGDYYVKIFKTIITPGQT